ncbi:MAG: class I SAM-dependent methyltransferase [Tepidisphaeraceae bacterium]
MNCYYCDQIARADPAYAPSPAVFDLGSPAPRCALHWRYLCGRCSSAVHFMSTAYCTAARKFFCQACAVEKDQVAEAFWAWPYYFRYRSPWDPQSWCAALDRLEFEGLHPLQRYDGHVASHSSISTERFLPRYPFKPNPWRLDHEPTDDELRAVWNANADRWHDRYDDGDPNRRFQSDEPMLAMLGDVRGLDVLDMGSGNGYLSRKLARAGARMTGVELSDRFVAIAREQEQRDNLGITYHHASAASMPFLRDASIDKIVSNYVLMDLRDYERAMTEAFRVLRPDGAFVVVISHPCFEAGQGWLVPAIDSPRPEERLGYLQDGYFHRGAYAGTWGNFDPVTSFHRPLRDYWETFRANGFEVEDFEEPSVSERGRRELPPWRVEKCLRIPYSCIFRLVKPVALVPSPGIPGEG